VQSAARAATCRDTRTTPGTKLVGDVSSETDPTKQKALYARVSDSLLDEAWNLPVSHVPNRKVSRSSVRGLRYELHEALNYTDVWLAV
jgi:ABC-type transport system substrate-binding protein